MYCLAVSLSEKLACSLSLSAWRFRDENRPPSSEFTTLDSLRRSLPGAWPFNAPGMNPPTFGDLLIAPALIGMRMRFQDFMTCSRQCVCLVSKSGDPLHIGDCDRATLSFLPCTNSVEWRETPILHENTNTQKETTVATSKTFVLYGFQNHFHYPQCFRRIVTYTYMYYCRSWTPVVDDCGHTVLGPDSSQNRAPSEKLPIGDKITFLLIQERHRVIIHGIIPWK